MNRTFVLMAALVLVGCTTTNPSNTTPTDGNQAGSGGAITAPVVPMATAATALQACQQVVAGLETLNYAASAPLLTAQGVPFKQLYDECDATNRFAGLPIPSKYTCSSDPSNVDFISRFDDGTVVFRAKMAVDGDGSPAAMGPNASGTDQWETWLTFDGSSDRKYVNAEDVPFVVVPSSTDLASFQLVSGIKRGDLAVAVSGNKCSFGVVGDSGPYFRLGEASTRTHIDLGNPQCAVVGQYPCEKLVAGGSGRGIAGGVTYMLFPGTRPRPLLSQTVVDIAATAASQHAVQFVQAYAK